MVLPVAAADQAGPRQSLVVVQIRDSLVVDNSRLLVDIADMAGVRRVRRSSVGSVTCPPRTKSQLQSVSSFQYLDCQTGCKW